MPATCIWLCESCQALGLGARNHKRHLDQWEVLEIAKEREEQEIIPIYGMKLEEIAALAKCYTAPYNTYGKIRSYVESTKKLPPRQFERRKHEEI